MIVLKKENNNNYLSQEGESLSQLANKFETDKGTAEASTLSWSKDYPNHQCMSYTMKPITFCIATAKNEKDYVTLLLNSLKDHTQFDLHEVLVFIDSDNQNTYESLLEMASKDFSNMKICKNPNEYPVGSQRNVSIMFDAAKNDIVCYLQSDMVVGKDFDKHIISNIEEGTVLACLRIEPPLHPPGPEKIVKDFGTTPETFDYKAFNLFVDELQKENRPNIEGHFAPFAIHKIDWFSKLGGFDTQFRCSREDSDTIIRMEMCGLKTIESWNACVYHFTCVSSRGTDWFKKDDEANYKNELQQNADLQELKRFIRKWGFFGHKPKSVYDISFVIELDRFANLELLKALEPYCKRMYLSDESIVSVLRTNLKFEAHYYSNLRWNYPTSYWDKVKHLFNPTDWTERLQTTPATIQIDNITADNQTDIKGDVIVSCKYSDLVKHNFSEVMNLIENIHDIVHHNEEGAFKGGPFVIQIKCKNDLSQSYKKASNIDLLLKDQTFKFL